MRYFTKSGTVFSPEINTILAGPECLDLKIIDSVKNSGDKLNLATPSVIYSLANLVTHDLLQEKLGYEKKNLQFSDGLASEIGADSLDVVEMALWLEKTIGLPIDENLQFDRIVDLTDFIHANIYKKFLSSNK